MQTKHVKNNKVGLPDEQTYVTTCHPKFMRFEHMLKVEWRLTRWFKEKKCFLIKLDTHSYKVSCVLNADKVRTAKVAFRKTVSAPAARIFPKNPWGPLNIRPFIACNYVGISQPHAGFNKNKRHGRQGQKVKHNGAVRHMVRTRTLTQAKFETVYEEKNIHADQISVCPGAYTSFAWSDKEDLVLDIRRRGCSKYKDMGIKLCNRNALRIKFTWIL